MSRWREGDVRLQTIKAASNAGLLHKLATDAVLTRRLTLFPLEGVLGAWIADGGLAAEQLNQGGYRFSVLA